LKFERLNAVILYGSIDEALVLAASIAAYGSGGIFDGDGGGSSGDNIFRR
jgi:hypothetical protein